MIAITCQCGRTYQLDEALKGKSVRCRHCGAALSTRGAATSAPPDATERRGGGRKPGAAPAGDAQARHYENLACYTLVRAFARGGMGKISVARDLALKREVALKELLEDSADSLGIQRRFITEAEITGQLEHPGVVPIYGLGADGEGKPFYAMRLIEGQTLKQALDAYHKSRHSAELRELLRRFVMVCHTMAYAHDRGVIHRDLKPANIMLGRFGETLVMDWGLAKPVRDGQSDNSTIGDLAERQLADASKHTATGGIVGTPAYMPPEQASGVEELGVTADIYSLGAVLYQLLTGRPPYSGGSSLEVLEKVKTDPPPGPHSVYPSVPRALEAICLKAMARRAKDRYATATELAESVQRWLDDEPVAAYSEPQLERIFRWSRKHKTAVVSGTICLVLTILIASAATVIYQRERDKARAAQRLADDYLRQAAEAEQRANEKETEAKRLAGEAEASRREAVEAMRREAQAALAANRANEKIAALEVELAEKAELRDELGRQIEATRAELTVAQGKAEAEAQRANAAADRAASLERQMVSLQREADEYRALARELTRLVGPLLNRQQQPALEANTPWEDLAQRDAELFDVVGSDGSGGTAASDTTRVRSGRQSLRASTKSAAGLCVTFPKSRNANWDLSKYEYLTLAFSLEGPDRDEVRRAELVVRIGRDSQCIEYRAAPEVLARVPRGWTFVKVPLTGESLWTKKEINPLDLSRVDWLQVCISTSSPAIVVWLDELSFGADPRKVVREMVPDADRAAAEYVSAVHGVLEAWVSGKKVVVRAMSDIPKDPFKVLTIGLNGNSDVNDAGLKLFAGLTDCWSLHLVGTNISDEGVASLKDMTSLVHLEIAQTRVGDAGVAALARLPHLSFVTVNGTKVSEAGLRSLQDLPAGLQVLGLSPASAPNGIAFLQGCPLRWLLIEADATRRMSDSFGKSLALFPNVSEASFINVQMTESQASHIAELRGLTRLTFIASAGWSDRALAKLSQLSNLEALVIFQTDSLFRDADLQPLGALTRLKTLDIQSDFVDPAGVMKLQMALPQCQITVSPKVQQSIDQTREKK